MQNDHDVAFKVIIVGDSGVGKSCFLLRFSDDIFTFNHMPTIGIDFKQKRIHVDGKVVKLTMWDTAGQEKFKALNSKYYANAHGVFIVYDITSIASFQHVEGWMKDVRESSSGESIVIFLVGNKSDLNEERQVTKDQGKNFAMQHGLSFLETSSKLGTNVNDCFEILSGQMLKLQSVVRQNKLEEDKVGFKLGGSESGATSTGSGSGCC